MLTLQFLKDLPQEYNQSHFIFRDNTPEKKNQIIFLNLSNKHKQFYPIDANYYSHGDGYCHELIKDLITAFSKADTYAEAILEWEVANIISHSKHVKCLCGVNIKERIIVENKYTHHKLRIGSVCVTKFIMTNKNNRSLLTISENINTVYHNITGSSLNKPVIDLALRRKIISKHQYQTYQSLTRGYGSRSHYDRQHNRFSKKKWIFRAMLNGLILLNLGYDNLDDRGQAHRPPCDRCNKTMVVKSCRIVTILQRLNQRGVCKPFFNSCPICQQTRNITDLEIRDNRDI